MENKEHKKEKTFDLKKEIREWFFILLTAAGIALFLNTFIIANSRVPSNSMETTIMTGDRIIGSRLAYITGDPQRGDIVIFNHKIDTSGKETRLVKRVIGLRRWRYPAAESILTVLRNRLRNRICMKRCDGRMTALKFLRAVT